MATLELIMLLISTQTLTIKGIIYSNHGTTVSGNNFRLNEGDRIVSLDDDTRLTFQVDGNLVLRSNAAAFSSITNQSAIWATDTQPEADGGYAIMQNDGNLVVRDTNQNSEWSSKTTNQGTSPYYLVVDYQCAYILSSDMSVLWDTNTTGCNGPLPTFAPPTRAPTPLTPSPTG